MHPLTDRQREILALAAQGLQDHAIADRIGVKPHTVRLHLMVIRQHLRARNTTHAVAIALTSNLISLEDKPYEAVSIDTRDGARVDVGVGECGTGRAGGDDA